ncbi:MAG: GNAT family N-acetyltransferase [Verrucomicrobiota bacterium]|jgi:ribosomal protein S18 acetylase RimI-like enzyme
MRTDLLGITLRPERPEDEVFRFELYASTRQEELDAWGWAPGLRASFLELQFKAQQACRLQFPQADFQMVLLAGRAIGRLVVDRAADEFRLVDIALLPQHQNTGLGTALIQELMAEAAAAGKPLRLTVLKGHRAARLYQRLGFAKTGESDLHEQMEWLAGSRMLDWPGKSTPG